MDYADRIFQLRQSRELTRKQLATSAGLSEEAVKGYEKRTRMPAYPYLLALADFFNVSLDYIAGRTDDPTPPKTTTTAQALTA